MEYNGEQNQQEQQYNRNKNRKISSQTLKQREIAIRAKFSKPWIKDEDSKSCFLCRKEFNFLYRRRHHCRKCAQVFCSSCSNYFLSTLIDDTQPVDKDTRLCQTCFQYCKEFMESDNQKHIDEDDSASSEDGDEPESLKVLNKIEYKEQFEFKLKTLIRYIFQQEKKLSTVPNFCEQYIEKTFAFTLYCLKNLRCRVRKQDGVKRNEKFFEMDINRYVIIKTCLHKDANQFTYINGIINSKNVAKKNMHTHFGPKKDMGSVISLGQKSSNSSFDGGSAPMQGSAQSPLQQQGVRCMVISVSVDIFSSNDTNYPDLQQVILKQKMYVQRIVEGIKQFKPQIIFCKENVNQDVLSQLEQEKITVVQKIKNDVILKIAECARCLIVDDISIILPSTANQTQQKISNNLTKNYIGNLYSAYFKTFQFATKQKTFMFLVQPEKSTSYHVSLLINGPELEILRQFKKNLQVILRLARHLYLEQEIIYTNNEMIKGNKKAKKLYIESLENDYVDFGNLNNFIDDKIGLGDYLYSDNAKFQYVKIQYKKAEWDQFDGVSSKEEFEKYILDKKINYESTKVHTLVKYCGEFEHDQISFYQVNDQSLAEFLMTIYVERNTACGTCKRPMYNHYQLFVKNKFYVKLSIVERMDPTIAKQAKDASISSRTKTEQVGQIIANTQNLIQAQKPIRGDEQMKYHQYQQSQNPNNPNNPNPNSNNSNNMNYQFNQSRNPARSPQKQQVEGLKKRRLHPKEPVLQYILCEHCHQIITTVHKSVIGKTLVDYSYNRFLQHMFQDYSEQYKKDKLNQLKDIKDIKEVNTYQSTVVQNKCQHSVRSRIFNIRDVEIKFQVGRTNVYSFNKLSFLPETVQNNIRECDQQYYKEAFQTFKQMFKAFVADAIARSTKLNEIVNQKKGSKQQAFINLIEMYKVCIERMEAEKDHILTNIDTSKITNYNSVLSMYILEQRINIASNRLNCLQKDIIKRKFKQFEKQHLDETIHSDLDNSILEDDFQDLKEIDQAKIFKGYCGTLNVQEERQKDDLQTQPFEYIPIYSKNQLSMMAWALNTKQYSKFLKDIGLGGQKVNKTTLIEMLKKRNADPSLDEKQRIEEYKVVIKIIKSQEMEIIVRHDQYFSNLNYTMRDSHLELSKTASTQDHSHIPRASSEQHQRSQSSCPSHFQQGTQTNINGGNHTCNNNNNNGQANEPNNLSYEQQSQNNELQTVESKSKDDKTKEVQDPNSQDYVIEQQQNNNNNSQNNKDNNNNVNNRSNSGEDRSSIKLNGHPIIQIKQSNSGNNIKDNLSNLFYKNNESKSSQSNLVEFGQNQENKSQNQENKSQSNNENKNSLKDQTINAQQPNNNQSQQSINLVQSQQFVGSSTNIPIQQSQSQQQHQQNHSSRIGHSSLLSNSYSQAAYLGQSQFDFENNYRYGTKQSDFSSANNLGGSGIGEKLSEVHILFAKQFEAFRNLHGISLERIIESLRTCSVVKLPGGQTQSVFVKSHDELFVVKEVSQLEFNYFQGFALNFFDHMSSNPNSLLSKMFGMFQICNEGEKIRYYAVMENLFYGIEKDQCQSYDLKGSKKRRFLKGTDIGLDTNFMIDMNCEPFFIDNSTYQQFDKIIRSDSDFLAQQEIVDYSLLLIVDKNKKSLRLGIIDYFRKFDLQKLLEKQIKGFIYGEDPTIIEPKKYQERFVKTLTKKFFCKV